MRSYKEALHREGPDMCRHRHHSLLPSGLIIDHIEIGETDIVAVARSRSGSSACPNCGRTSTRIHSRYGRCLADLPAHGRRVRISLEVRRFRCSVANCPRVIFAVRRRDRAALRPPYGAVAEYCSSPRAGAGRPPGTKLGEASSASSQQGHAPASRAHAFTRRLAGAADRRDR